jgi:outer membrane protein OmpA-like peptidoglycan-associated protein
MRKLVIFLITVLGISSKVLSQDNYVLYNMRMIPQSHYLNPSFFPQQKVYIGISPMNIPIFPILPIPVLNSFYFSKGNSGPRLIDFFTKDGDSTIIDLNKAMSKSAKINNLSLDVAIDLMSFGFKVKRNYFTFNATSKFSILFQYPKDFLSLINDGNGGNNINKPLNFKFGLNAHQYNEYALGYMREVLEDKLWIGGKVKFYQGLSNFQTKKNDFILLTGDTAYELTIKTDAQFNAAGPVVAIFDTTYKVPDGAGYFTNFSNTGFGLDLGATYKFNEKFSLSASAIDLGFINYKSDIANYSILGDFRFTGIDLKKVIQDSSDIEQSFSDALDSLTKSIKGTTTFNSYKQFMPTQIYASANYKLNDYFTAGGLFHTKFITGTPNFGGSLSLTTQVKKWLNTTLAYNIYNRSFGNLGFGLGFNIWFMQSYIMFDNLLAFTSFSKVGASGSFVPIPTGYRNMNIRLGANWTFGRKDQPKDKDKDGIPDKADKCPEIKGLVELNGCPDKDGDKVADLDDKCPDTPGKITLAGCPDQDNDDIADAEDACPTQAGKKETNGCPDQDGDGIIDSEDQCPTEAGTKELKGCPDKDGDGIADKNDACPELAGMAEYDGCPDTDNDGLPDNKDLCPDVPGPKDNKGCPYKDTDNDGVLDKDDKCPDKPGPAENKGCPIGDADGDGVPDNKDQCPQTPGPADNNGCPRIDKAEEEKLKTIFNNIEFETGKAILRETCFDELNELVELMNKKPEWKLLIEGHTDNVGKPAANLKLSQDRAQALVNYLVSKGINKARLIAKGYGDKKPIASNKTPEGRAKNRRVEMKVLFE